MFHKIVKTESDAGDSGAPLAPPRSRLGAYCRSVDDRTPTKRHSIAMPTAHLMALAPLDIWIRLLISARGVHPRYWLRAAFILFTSFIGMACCVHERLVMLPIRLIKFGRDAVFDHPPGVVIVVGYYRSGTTHLHNLLSCDRRVVTPRWYQALGPQGFWFGWSLIRVMLVPFLSSTRPQDGVAFGPEWPAEDDFALCNWGLCSTLPGRFVFPSRWDRWSRWNTLDGLSDRQRSRWRSLTAMFCWKTTRGRSNRVLVLKTPSHSSKIAELDRLFNGRARFVHIARDPVKVIDSNVNMHLQLRPHLLEDPPGAQEIRQRIVEEYEQIETRCSAELEKIDDARKVFVHHAELVNDPLAVLGEVYASIGIPHDEHARDCAAEYLHEIGEYRTPSSKKSQQLGEPTEQEHDWCARFASMRGLHTPPRPSVNLPEYVPTHAEGSLLRGMIGAMVGAAVFAGLWIGFFAINHALNPDSHTRVDQLVWLMGAAVGLVGLRAGRRGSRSLGMVCVLWVAVAWVAVIYMSGSIYWDHGSGGWNTVKHNFKGVWYGVNASSVRIYGILAMITAYKHGSRTGPNPPGR